MIDFVVVSSDLCLYFGQRKGLSCRHLVVCWIRWRGKLLDGHCESKVRVNWEGPLEDPVQQVFNSHLWRSFSSRGRCMLLCCYDWFVSSMLHGVQRQCLSGYHTAQTPWERLCLMGAGKENLAEQCKLFTLSQIQEGSWEIVHPVCMCFVDMK